MNGHKNSTTVLIALPVVEVTAVLETVLLPALAMDAILVATFMTQVFVPRFISSSYLGDGNVKLSELVSKHKLRKREL